MVSAVFNYVPQPAAMTFAFFSSVIILLLCSTDDIYPAKLHYTSLQKTRLLLQHFVIYKSRLQPGKFFFKYLYIGLTPPCTDDIYTAENFHTNNSPRKPRLLLFCNL